MAAHAPELKSIFCGALEQSPGSERTAFLDEACQSNEDLRAKVEELLAAHEQAGHFLAQATSGATAANPGGAETHPDADSPPRPTDTTDSADFAETVSTRTREATRAHASRTLLPSGMATGEFPAGSLTASTTRADRTGGLVGGQLIADRYALREVLGEGGMGTVYRADQTEPVKRQVALKLIKIGMDSRAVLARFDAERQALALMDHPNIARVYDGGTTPTGQPFFVMELVSGVPITDYCDQKRLSMRARLELFVAVCQAVQHAHQKGIIHRDIKPSNVMVTEVGGRPTPKVIDFGVAKATGFDLTDLSFADTGAIVGTPTYMSPEQADPSSMDIDTRTDVYALGVILYELLAGSPPLDPSQFKRGRSWRCSAWCGRLTHRSRAQG